MLSVLVVSIFSPIKPCYFYLFDCSCKKLFLPFESGRPFISVCQIKTFLIYFWFRGSSFYNAWNVLDYLPVNSTIFVLVDGDHCSCL